MTRFSQLLDQLSLKSVVLARRRERRCQAMLELVSVPREQPEPEFRVLDVGCGWDGRSFEQFAPDWMQIHGIDLFEPEDIEIDHPGFLYEKRDLTDLSHYPDDVFDLVVSIGVMEHVTEMRDLDRVAWEINRISKRYVIVVPWRYAWIEPHFKFPFFQLLPTELQNRLTLWLDLHGKADVVRTDPNYIRRRYQWFTSEQWQSIWPSSEVSVLPTGEMIAIYKSPT